MIELVSSIFAKFLPGKSARLKYGEDIFMAKKIRRLMKRYSAFININ